MGLGAQREVRTGLARAEQRYGLTPDEFKQIEKDLMIKLTKFDRGRSELVEFSKRNNAPLPPEIIDPDPSLIPAVIGGHLVRKIFQENISSQATTQFGTRNGFSRKPASMNLGNMDAKGSGFLEVEIPFAKEAARIFSFGRQFEFYGVSMLMPYLQGVFLYALALFFPFFAVMSVVPSQSRAILMWMMMWVWVKSWDIGWAIIMVIDKLLWQLMPGGHTLDFVSDPTNGPIGIFQAAFDFDPSYTLFTYYSIISLLIIGIPLLSAQIFLKNASSFFAPFLSGLKEVSSFFTERLSHQESENSIRTLETERQRYMFDKAFSGKRSAEAEQFIKPLEDYSQNLGKIRNYFATQKDAKIDMEQFSSMKGLLDVVNSPGVPASRWYTAGELVNRLDQKIASVNNATQVMKRQFSAVEGRMDLLPSLNKSAQSQINTRNEDWDNVTLGGGMYSQEYSRLIGESYWASKTIQALTEQQRAPLK
jgi:hypothetical protein